MERDYEAGYEDTNTLDFIYISFVSVTRDLEQL